MSRIVQLNGTGKQRDLLVKSIVLALRELASSREVNTDTRDQAAYISLALKAINDSIDPTVAAWEKRGYWLKADRFRMDWAWTGQMAVQLKETLLQDDWGTGGSGVRQSLHKIGVRHATKAQPDGYPVGGCLGEDVRCASPQSQLKIWLPAV